MLFKSSFDTYNMNTTYFDTATHRHTKLFLKKVAYLLQQRNILSQFFAEKLEANLFKNEYISHPTQ
jgi:hypothetical protein